MKTIAQYGSEKIKNGMKIFTHCYSKTVITMIKKAHQEGKKIEIINTETRPKFLGRRTSKKLSSLDIPVTHVLDSISRTYLKNCDMLLLGCEIFLKDGSIMNKIGSQMLVACAKENKIPVYICTSLKKFSPTKKKIEERNPAQVWKNAPKKITIPNPAYEYVSSQFITGFITEIGIIKPQKIYETLRIRNAR